MGKEKGKRILLDAGHGGTDAGAVSGGVSEEGINLGICLRLAERLRESGHIVILTRDKDAGLSPEERLVKIREYQPDAFVSVHCNAAKNPQAHGVETLYRDDFDYPLAAEIQKALIATTNMTDRGIKNDEKELGRRLAVLGDKETPSCLVEIGFISNRGDLKLIMEEQELIVEALLDGINNWANNG